MKTTSIVIATVFIASAAFAHEKSEFDKPASELLRMSLASTSSGLSCMQAKAACEGSLEHPMFGTPAQNRTNVRQSYKCLKDYLNCVRGSLGTLDGDLAVIEPLVIGE